MQEEGSRNQPEVQCERTESEEKCGSKSASNACRGISFCNASHFLRLNEKKGEEEKEREGGENLKKKRVNRPGKIIAVFCGEYFATPMIFLELARG